MNQRGGVSVPGLYTVYEYSHINHLDAPLVLPNTLCGWAPGKPRFLGNLSRIVAKHLVSLAPLYV